MAFLRDERNRAIGILGITRDISKRKKADEALKKSEDRHRTSIELTQQLAWNTNYKGEVVEDIPHWRKFTGQNYEEVKGTGWTKALHPDDVERTVQVWKKAIETKKMYETEYRVRRFDGVYRCFLTRGVPMLKEGGNIREWVGICIDITERKKAEEKLTQAYDELRRTQEQLIQSSKMAAMGQLAAGISHELNQPLTGIKGFAQAAFEDLDDKNPAREDLSKIIEQTDRMDKIIKNMRFFAKKSEFTMEELDINKPIEDAIALLSEQLKVHNIELQRRLAKDLPKIQGDSNQLQQVFLNLLSNSRDAMEILKRPEGGKITIKTSLAKDKNYIEIIVEDTGCGISKENQHNIFNPFFTTKSPSGGMGLGLSITYRIIEAHKGAISFESAEGKGTMFKILLPITDNRPQTTDYRPRTTDNRHA